MLWPAPPGRFVCEDLGHPRRASDRDPRRQRLHSAPRASPPLRNLKGLRLFAPHGRGWLAGTNMGEFGGGLYVVEPGRRPRLIGDDPFADIARTDGEIRVVSNRGQSSFPDGAVWPATGGIGHLGGSAPGRVAVRELRRSRGSGGSAGDQNVPRSHRRGAYGRRADRPCGSLGPTSKRSCKPFLIRRPCWRSSIAWACLGIR